MDFRPDINALRALAVVAVMLYHFKLPGVTGGFSGVDVFFVISGFLMTGIIVGGMTRGTFSLWRFYTSRARRLLPALIVMCFALLLAGWFWLPPTDYKELGRHAAASLIFVSNFVFNNETGYFGTISQDKWLLHTWSLSVEWQFYLVYPLLLIGLQQIKGGLKLAHLGFALAFITLASLAFSIVYTPHDPAFAFFLLPARLWEMSLGGLAYVLTKTRPVQHHNGWLASAGLALIASGFVLFSEGTIWPGSAALLPAIGTVLVLIAQAPLPRMINSAPVATLGLWSYSIYLWHWPVVVTLRHFDVEHSLIWDLTGVALSVAFGGLSYRWIETPLRSTAFARPVLRLRTAVITASFFIVALSGWAIDRSEGVDSRAQASVLRIEQDIADYKLQKPIRCQSDSIVASKPPCTKTTAAPDYVLWGDSHAGSVFPALSRAAGQARQGHAYVATCPPVPDAYLKSKNYTYICPGFTDDVLTRIEGLPENIPLVVAFRMSVYTEGYNESPDKPVGLTFIDDTNAAETTATPESFGETLTDTLCALSDEGRPVYVMQPTPEFGIDVPREISRDIMFEGKADDITLPLTDYYDRQRAVINTLKTAQSRCGIHVLDPTPYLCSDGVCHGSIDGQPLYSDDNHIGMHGAKMLVPMFSQIFPAPL